MTTKREREWFRRFYDGTLLVKGWQARMDDLLNAVPDYEKESS